MFSTTHAHRPLTTAYLKYPIGQNLFALADFETAWNTPTGIKTAHEANLAINNKKFLMVGPEENNVVVGSIKAQQLITRGLGLVENGKVLKGLREVGLQTVVRQGVVRMAEHPNVRVQGLEVRAGVLPCLSCSTTVMMRVYLRAS